MKYSKPFTAQQLANKNFMAKASKIHKQELIGTMVLGGLLLTALIVGFSFVMFHISNHI